MLGLHRKVILKAILELLEESMTLSLIDLNNILIGTLFII